MEKAYEDFLATFKISAGDRDHKIKVTIELYCYRGILVQCRDSEGETILIPCFFIHFPLKFFETHEFSRLNPINDIAQSDFDK